MKAADFSYRRPADLAGAVGILAAEGGEAVPLAGGQSLMPMMNFRIAQPAMLADIAELRGLSRGDGGLRIGAMTRYAELAADPRVKQGAPLFGLALPHIAHAAIRNRGTIGGSVALADPAAEAALAAEMPEGAALIAAVDSLSHLPFDGDLHTPPDIKLKLAGVVLRRALAGI